MTGYKQLAYDLKYRKNGHHFILQEMYWLKHIMEWRLDVHFSGETKRELSDIQPPAYESSSGTYAKFVVKAPVPERLILILALAPHILPSFLGDIIHGKIPVAGDYPLIGGAKSTSFRGFLPTGETAMFLLGGDNIEKRLEYASLFSSGHHLNNVVSLEPTPAGEPFLSGRLIVEQEYVDLFLTGKVSTPKFGASFPAQLLQTRLSWNDLVLNPKTAKQIDEILLWLQHHETLNHTWGMNDKLSPGYRALFYGAPGTGKTLTAKLLGKLTGLDVYRIDLSSVISKYIGETEKNLASLFNKAENKKWVLFFDEADSLFGKRTSIRDAHDKYANQEVAFLLQRIETYDGLVILATNFRNNIDEAFVRRFQSVIYFPMPQPNERQAIWEKAFPKQVKLESKLSLPEISRQYEISGANIMNIVQYCCLQSLARGDHKILLNDIHEGIKKEYAKEGKIA